MPGVLKKIIRLGYLLALLISITGVTPVQADGGFAMSGSFNSQKLDLPQGTILRTPDIYVVIFNNSSQDYNVRMTTKAPLGVEIVLSEVDFLLKAGTQKKVEVGLDISSDAIPGQYKIGIVAETYRNEGEGIQIVGAASQEADLTITGESATLDISTVSPDETAVPAMIILSRKTDTGDFEIARTETGRLQITVSPGSYVTRAYVAGIKLAEESFTVAVNEQKILKLTVRTVYFESFEIVANYQEETGKLGTVQVVYSVNNLLTAFPSAQVNLNVGYNQSPSENIPLIKLAPLEKGRVELSYTFQPANGWRQGVYKFTLELEVNKKIYTTSPEKELTVDKVQAGQPAGADDKPGTSTSTWLIIAGVAVGVLVAVNVTLLMRRRK